MVDFSKLISNDLLTLHEDGIDALLNSSVAKQVTLVYPPKWVNCPACQERRIGNHTTTFYNHGRPGPIPNASRCTMCNGTQKIESSATENLNFLIYWTPKEWINLGRKIEGPDGVVQIKTFAYNIPKILKTDEFILVSDKENVWRYRYSLDGEPVLHGFRSKYTLAFLRRK